METLKFEEKTVEKDCNHFNMVYIDGYYVCMDCPFRVIESSFLEQ